MQAIGGKVTVAFDNGPSLRITGRVLDVLKCSIHSLFVQPRENVLRMLAVVGWPSMESVMLSRRWAQRAGTKVLPAGAVGLLPASAG